MIMDYYNTCFFLVLVIAGVFLVDGAKVKNVSRSRTKRQFAAFTQSENFSNSGPGPELVMSCDINEDGYDQEDALVLNLRFAESSNQIVHSLKQQQDDIRQQMNEILELFKETHKEQARLMELQNALRQQNSQLMALYGNIMKNNLAPNTPGRMQEIFDLMAKSIESDEEQRVSRSKPEKSGHVTRSTPSDHGEIAEDKIRVSKTDPVIENEVEEDGFLSRSVISGGNDAISSPELAIPDILVPEDVGDLDDVADEAYDAMCRGCNEEEYCAVEDETAQCYPCTECSPGYILTSRCTKYHDITCEDKNECVVFGQQNTCQEEGVECVNSPGGYLCLGGDASCIDGYFFNRRASQCEPCSSCVSQQHVIVPCSKFSDVICRTDDMEQQTDVWTGILRKPNKILKNIGELNDGHSLPFSDASRHNQTVLEVVRSRKKSRSSIQPSSLKRDAQNSLKLLQHGIIWMEYNIALLHSCRSYLQASFLISDDASSQGAVLGQIESRSVQISSEQRRLAAARIEHSLGDRYKFLNLGAVAETQPTQELQVKIRSAHRGCVTTPTGNDRYALRSVAANAKSGPFSVLWLSHDTGAVAYRATAKNSRASSTLYAEFTQEYASDLHVVQLSHSGRYFEFREAGIVLAKYHQALYSIGDSCVEYGYSMICMIERAKGESGETLVRTHKSGVTYTDTSMSMTLMTSVESGDRFALDLQAPARCQMRYTSDLNLGVVNLLWVPRQSAAGLLARLDHRDEIVGSMKSKILTFVETQNTNPSKIATRSDSYFEFKETGRIYVNYATRAVHSCDYLKAAIHYVSDASGSANSIEIAQQVLGDTNGRWDGLSLGTSHSVEVGSMCYISVTCVRGRVDEMSYGEWSTLSILWVPL